MADARRALPLLVAGFTWFQITQRGRTLPEGADEFIAFLRADFVGWAARAGVA